MSETEVWKIIPDAVEYEASNFGRIRRSGPDRCGRKPKILSPAVKKSTGRLQVSICRNGAIKAELVNRLVAKAFHGLPPEDRPFCCHIDGDHLNNRPENLYWGTPRLNALDAVKHGTTQFGARNVNAKLDEDAVRAIRASTGSSTVLAKEFGISVSTFCRIRNGQGWKHVA